jgi:hypothetical protein
MERQVISKEKLISILNEELSKHEECADCQFETRIVKLKKVDEAGCNWTTLGLKCSGLTVDACSRTVQQIVSDARNRYNIND